MSNRWQGARLALRRHRSAQLGLGLLVYVLLVLLMEGATYVGQGHWPTYTTANSPLRSDYVTDLAADSQGGVWIGTPAGLYHLSADGRWQTDFTAAAGYPGGRISVLAVDGAGQLWVGTDQGLAVLTSDRRWISNLPHGDGFDQVKILAIAFDRDDRAWVGTAPADLWLLEGEADPALYPQAHPVWALAIDAHGRVWAGSDAGLYRRDLDGQWTAFRFDPHYPRRGLLQDEIISLAIDGDDRVWVGTVNRGLSLLAPDGQWTAYPYPHAQGEPPGPSRFRSGRITALLPDGLGRHWVGTDEELVMIDTDARWTTYTPANSGLPGAVLAVAEGAPGQLWVATNKGLSVLDLRAGRPRHLPEAWLQLRSALELPMKIVAVPAIFAWAMLQPNAATAPFCAALALNLVAIFVVLLTRPSHGWWRRNGPLLLLVITALIMMLILFSFNWMRLISD